jgi:hypothetical protein
VDSLRTVNYLTMGALSPGMPGWEDNGDICRVLGELRTLTERLPQAYGQIARHLEPPRAGCVYEVDAMTDEPALIVVATAVLALDDARRGAYRTGEHLNEALSAVAHLHM